MQIQSDLWNQDDQALGPGESGESLIRPLALIEMII